MLQEDVCLTLLPKNAHGITQGPTLSLSLINCVLCVFVGVFEKLVLFCGPERGEELILLELANIMTLNIFDQGSVISSNTSYI